MDPHYQRGLITKDALFPRVLGKNIFFSLRKRELWEISLDICNQTSNKPPQSLHYICQQTHMVPLHIYHNAKIWQWCLSFINFLIHNGVTCFPPKHKHGKQSCEQQRCKWEKYTNDPLSPLWQTFWRTVLHTYRLPSIHKISVCNILLQLLWHVCIQSSIQSGEHSTSAGACSLTQAIIMLKLW